MSEVGKFISIPVIEPLIIEIWNHLSGCKGTIPPIVVCSDCTECIKKSLKIPKEGNQK